MDKLEQQDLIYRWDNSGLDISKLQQEIQVLDTTLRDGLQDPAIKMPTIEEKIELVDLMAKVGIDAADIGFPVNSETHKNEVIEIAKHLKEKKLGIKVCVLARTQTPDIEAAIEVSQKAGVEVEAITIVGSSKVRQIVEKWDKTAINKWIFDSIKLGVDNGLEINFLTEDGTRTHPERLKEFYKNAVEAGATRVTIADTVGAATPTGAWNITKYMKDEILKDDSIIIDWHGHNDRDLGTANALASAFAGAKRVHTTILGIGERAGNTQLEGFLINTEMFGMTNKNLKMVKELANYATDIFDFPIPSNYPGVGSLVHSTSVGIHASAIMKARSEGNEYLANNVYSGVDPEAFGEIAEIHVGPLSGRANVVYVLETKLKIKATDENVAKVLEYARNKNKVLKEDEILKILQ